MTEQPVIGLTHVRADGSAHMVDVSAKAVDKHARITDARVTAKSGGRSGDWAEL